MALVIENRVKETSTTSGTGSIALNGAMTGFKAFSDVCVNSDTVYYTIQGVDGVGATTNEWEVGLGSWSTGNILNRTTVLSSSNGNNIVNFSAGVKHVWLDIPAQQVKTLMPPTISDVSTTSYRQSTTLPDATKCFIGQQFQYINNGFYDRLIKDYNGNSIGYIGQFSIETVTCSDNSTTSGGWIHSLARLGVTCEANLPIGISGDGGKPISWDIDSTRKAFVLYGSASIWCVVHDNTTNTFGTPTLIRTASISSTTSTTAVAGDANQALVVSIAGTALEAVGLTFSGTSVSVTSPHAVTLGGAIDSSQCRLVRVGTSSSYAFVYSRATVQWSMRAIGYAGAQPFVDVETTIQSGGSVTALYSHSNSVVSVLSVTGTTAISCNVYSISGTTITVGTAATFASGTNIFRSKQLEDGRVIVAYTLSGSIGIGVFNISGTVATGSSQTFTTSSGAVREWVEISPSKVLFISGWIGYSTARHALIDGAGNVTLSSETTIPMSHNSVQLLRKSGNISEFITGQGSQYVYLIVDSSLSAPSFTFNYNPILGFASSSSDTVTGEISGYVIPTGTSDVMTLGNLNTSNQSPILFKQGTMSQQKGCRISTTSNYAIYGVAAKSRWLLKAMGSNTGTYYTFSLVEAI